MNSYPMETPIQTLLNDFSYVDMLDTKIGKEVAYSYVFSGQSGYLDYVLASPSLVAFITGAGEWHINCDEPPVMDYNTEFKAGDHKEALYNPGPFRSSDHDPVFVGIHFGSEPLANETVANSNSPPTTSSALTLSIDPMRIVLFLLSAVAYVVIA